MTNKRVQYIEGTKSEVIPAPTAGSQYLRRNAGNTGWELVTISPGATSATLSDILTNGNTTDGYDIILSSGDAIGSADGYVNISGHLSVSNGLNLSNKKITSVLDPTAPQDVSTKKYTDDHIIPLTSAAPVSIDKSAAVVGTATTSARADHKHNILTGVAGPVGTGNTEGVATTLARSDHTHAVKDLSFDFQAQGDILYYNGTNWAILTPGTDGYVLTTHSASQNPTWSSLPDLSPSILTRTLNNIIYVDNTFSGISTGSINKPYSTIAAAISAATTGTHIILTPGTYSETLSIPSNKNLKISSISYTSLVECTIVGEITWTFKDGSELDIDGINLTSGMLLKDGDSGIGKVQLRITNSTYGDIVNGNFSSYTHDIDIDIVGQGFSTNGQTNGHSINASGNVSINNCTLSGSVICSKFYGDQVYFGNSITISTKDYAIVTNSEFGSGVIFNFTNSGGVFNVDVTSNYFAVNSGVSLTGTGATKVILKIAGDALTDGYSIGQALIWDGYVWLPGSVVGNTAPVNVDKSLANAGTSIIAARSDHKHNIATASAVSIGSVNAEGTSVNLARADHTHAVIDLSLLGQVQGSILYFNGTNWVVLTPGTDGYVLTAKGIAANPIWKQPTGGAGPALAAGTQTATSGTVSFINSNGISFGMSNSNQITASYTVPTQTAQTIGLYALGNTTQNSSTTLDARTLSFNGLGAATVGYSNGSIQVSVPTQSAQTQSNIQAIYDGANSISTGTIRFTNANGVSFSINGQTISGSVAAQTNQSIGLYALGNTTQNSSTTLDARSLSFNGLGIITAGYSNGSIQISATQSVQTQSNIQGISAGTQLGQTGNVVFSNSNGISFGLSNSSIMTASYTVPNTAGLLSAINISAGTTSNNLSAITFSNSNGLSFGLNGSTITGSYTVPTQTNQSVGLYALGNTTQNSSTTLDARSLSFNGLGIITAGYSNGSIQISATQSAQTQNIVVPSAGTQTATSGTVIFGNSNGISFGMSGSSQITASYTVPVQTNQTEGRYALGNTTGQSSSSTFDARTMSISGAGNISVGYSGNALIISGSQSNQTVNVVVPSAGTQSATSGTVVFSNSNGISFGMSNSNQITASYTVPSTAGLISGVNISAGTTSNNLTALTFSNSNGLSFGLNGSVVTGSYTVPTQTVQTEGRYAVGNTTGQSSSSTFDARTLSISGAGVASVGYSAGNLIISVPSGIANINASAGTTSNNLTNFVFSNSNNVSFGLNGSTITASITNQSNQTIGGYVNGVTIGESSSTTYDARSMSVSIKGWAFGGYSAGQLQISVPTPTINISAGTTANNDIAVIFSNSNNVSFGKNGIQITASASFAQTSLSYSNQNGISFGIAGSTLTASYTVPTQTNQSVGFYALGNTTQNSSTTLDARTLSFNGLGGNTVGYSNGSIQISGVTTVGLISKINISAGTTSNNLTNFVFSNSNNLSFGLNGSTITGSYSQTVQTLGIYASGNTSGDSSSSTFNAQSLSISAINGASVGMSGNQVLINARKGFEYGRVITITGDYTLVDLDECAFLNVNVAGPITITLPAFITIPWKYMRITIFNQTGVKVTVVTVSGGIYQHSAGGNLPSVSCSGYSAMIYLDYFNTNGWVASGDLDFLAIGRSDNILGSTLSQFQWGNNLLVFQPLMVQCNAIFSQINLPLSISYNTQTNSTFNGTIKFSAGLYTRTGQSLFQFTSGSGQYTFTASGQNMTGSLTGSRIFTMPMNMNLVPGDYYIGIVSLSSISTVTQALSISNLGPVQASAQWGMLGAATNDTVQNPLGYGYYSATTSSMPASVGFSQISGALNPRILWGYEFRNY